MHREQGDIPHSTSRFSDLGLAPLLLDILNKKNIEHPTPIQHQAIPPVLTGKDIIGIAQTGTGKTWAFGLPMLQRLAQGKGRGLILVPTRELAYQVEESLASFAQAFRIGT
ncbi:MAG: DEAD/DEAH box helicase, partial [Patescibacteria group bacterium]